MFKRILLPLDGSKLAECVCSSAAYLCEKTDASILLIHVIEKNAPNLVHGEHHLTGIREAEQYLDEIAQAYFPPQIRVEKHVHTDEVDNVADSIAGHAGEYASDLVIMAAHGKHGLHDWTVGNIAQQVIGHGKTPVLLLRPDSCGKPLAFNHILIALDGESEHETGLPLVAGLAKVLSADILLCQVVPTLDTLTPKESASGKLLPGTTSVFLDIAEDEACRHLEDHAVELRAKGLEVKTCVERGDPTARVVETARDSDLIVLGTHGKAGIKAFWAGSVASKIIGQTRLPILLIPVTRESD